MNEEVMTIYAMEVPKVLPPDARVDGIFEGRLDDTFNSI